MTWMELRIHTTAEALDWVRTLLSQTDYISDIAITPHHSVSNPGLTEPHDTPPWAFTVCVYFPHNFQTSTRLGDIDSLFASLYRTGLIADPDIAVVDTQPDLTSIANTVMQRIGKRFVVLSSDNTDHTARTNPDEIVLCLGKTMSFGSGSHPATIAILQLLERHVKTGMRALDLGSGSGILSVAMAKLGATVLALDNDHVAVQATQNAVVQNSVEHQVTVERGSLGCGNDMGHWINLNIDPIDPMAGGTTTRTFDLIAANILGRMHIALATDYRNALHPTMTNPGYLLISGFTTDYETDIHVALTEAGFTLCDREQLGEWIALAYQLIDD